MRSMVQKLDGKMSNSNKPDDKVNGFTYHSRTTNSRVKRQFTSCICSKLTSLREVSTDSSSTEDDDRSCVSNEKKPSSLINEERYSKTLGPSYCPLQAQSNGQFGTKGSNLLLS